MELLRGLEQQDLTDRMLLVVLSDHGDRADSFNDAQSLYESFQTQLNRFAARYQR